VTGTKGVQVDGKRPPENSQAHQPNGRSHLVQCPFSLTRKGSRRVKQIPFADRSMQREQREREGCQTVYLTLLRLLYPKSRQDPCPSHAAFVRTLIWQTKACDGVHDLSELRGLYRKKIGSDRMDRVLRRDFSEWERDEVYIDQAVTHYRYWTRVSLIRALSWRNRLYYHTLFQLHVKYGRVLGF